MTRRLWLLPEPATILVVENEELFTEFIARFSPSDYRLQFTADLAQARKLCQTSTPALVVVPAESDSPEHAPFLQELGRLDTKVLGLAAAAAAPPEHVDQLAVPSDPDEAFEAVTGLLSDRRRRPRVAAQVEVELEGIGKATSSEVSATSLFVSCAEPLEVGARIGIQLQSSEGTVQGEAQVVRVAATRADGKSGTVLVISEESEVFRHLDRIVSATIHDEQLGVRSAELSALRDEMLGRLEALQQAQDEIVQDLGRRSEQLTALGSGIDQVAQVASDAGLTIKEDRRASARQLAYLHQSLEGDLGDLQVWQMELSNRLDEMVGAQSAEGASSDQVLGFERALAQRKEDLEALTKRVVRLTHAGATSRQVQQRREEELASRLEALEAQIEQLAGERETPEQKTNVEAPDSVDELAGRLVALGQRIGGLAGEDAARRSQEQKPTDPSGRLERGGQSPPKSGEHGAHPGGVATGQAKQRLEEQVNQRAELISVITEQANRTIKGDAKERQSYGTELTGLQQELLGHSQKIARLSSQVEEEAPGGALAMRRRALAALARSLAEDSGELRIKAKATPDDQHVEEDHETVASGGTLDGVDVEPSGYHSYDDDQHTPVVTPEKLWDLTHAPPVSPAAPPPALPPAPTPIVKAEAETEPAPPAPGPALESAQQPAPALPFEPPPAPSPEPPPEQPVSPPTPPPEFVADVATESLRRRSRLPYAIALGVLALAGLVSLIGVGLTRGGQDEDPAATGPLVADAAAADAAATAAQAARPDPVAPASLPSGQVDAGTGASNGVGGVTDASLSEQGGQPKPRPPDVRLQLIIQARYLIKHKRHSAARRRLTRAIKMRDGATARLLMARSHEHAGELWPAVYHLRRATARARGARTRARLKDHLGLLYIKLGKQALACRAFRVARATNKTSRSAKRHLQQHCAK